MCSQSCLPGFSLLCMFWFRYSNSLILSSIVSNLMFNVS